MSISDCRTVEVKSQLVRLLDGKVIGWFEGDTFIKPVVGSKHKLRKPPSWAIQAEAFDEEVKPNARELVIIDRESGLRYRVSIETFARHSFRLNRGFGDQYALPIRFFQVEGNGHRQLTLWGNGNG